MHQKFPATRLRRNRIASWAISLGAEHTVTTHDLVLPLFVQDGNNLKTPIQSMPGCYVYSIDQLILVALEAQQCGIQAIALFPKVAQHFKSESGDEALNKDNLICRAIKALKDAGVVMGIIVDIALDPYTTHGHDGVLVNDLIDNDKTLDRLAEQASLLAHAGADVLAPSDMMDGRIGMIRSRLESERHQDIILLSYAVKYASKFYGPFRDAIGSQSHLGTKDKTTYQMHIANSKEAITEVALDLQEGADWIMVKPGMPYLDVIHLISLNFQAPLFAYQVSGEYSMIHHLAQTTQQPFMDLMYEALVGFKRAGAQAIFCYAALEVAKSLG